MAQDVCHPGASAGWPSLEEYLDSPGLPLFGEKPSGTAGKDGECGKQTFAGGEGTLCIV